MKPKQTKRTPQGSIPLASALLASAPPHARCFRYHCIIYEPLGMSQQDHTLNPGVAQWTATYVLNVVDYLHTSGVVHTGIRLRIYEVLVFTDDRL